MLQRLIMVLAVVFLSACSGDNFSEYVGHWERDGVHQVVKISEEGDSLIFRENILNDKTGPFSGANSEPHTLIKREGQLLLEGQIALGLSEDKNQLIISGRTYKRIHEARIDEIKRIQAEKKAAAEKRLQEMARLKAEKQKHAQLCSQVWDEYSSKYRVLQDEYTAKSRAFRGPYKERMVMKAERKEKEKALAAVYRARQDEIGNCKPTIR